MRRSPSDNLRAAETIAETLPGQVAAFEAAVGSKFSEAEKDEVARVATAVAVVKDDVAPVHAEHAAWDAAGAVALRRAEQNVAALTERLDQVVFKLRSSGGVDVEPGTKIAGHTP